MAQRVKCLPVMQETWVRSLGREDPLEKEMATHSSILAWKIPWTEEPGRLAVHGIAESDTTERLDFHKKNLGRAFFGDSSEPNLDIESFLEYKIFYFPY